MVLTKYGESSIIIINVLRITDCDENRDARLICFSARFINHFYLLQMKGKTSRKGRLPSG